jgi:hypothetical protein
MSKFAPGRSIRRDVILAPVYRPSSGWEETMLRTLRHASHGHVSPNFAELSLGALTAGVLLATLFGWTVWIISRLGALM